MPEISVANPHLAPFLIGSSLFNIEGARVIQSDHAYHAKVKYNDHLLTVISKYNIESNRVTHEFYEYSREINNDIKLLTYIGNDGHNLKNRLDVSIARLDANNKRMSCFPAALVSMICLVITMAGVNIGYNMGLFGDFY